MKTRKLLAMLVAVAMIVTMLPVVAFAAEDEEPAGPAVPDASRIYASDDEVDTDEDVTVTVYLRDATGKSASLATSDNLYIWAERSEDRVSQIDTVKEVKLDGEAVSVEANADGVVVLDGNQEYDAVADNVENIPMNTVEKVEVKYESNFDGEVKFWFGIDTEWPVDIEDVKADYATVVFEYVEGYKLIYDGDKDDFKGANYKPADGITSHKVELLVVDEHGFPVKGEQVNFDTDSSRLMLNKDSDVSDSAGKVDVKATSERAGVYTLYAELDSDRKVELVFDEDTDAEQEGIELEFRASAAYDISVKKGDGAVVALDQEYTFEFEVFDIFGRLIKGVEENDGEALIEEYVEEITVPTSPDKADLDDDNVDDNVTWKENENLKVKVGSGLLDEEGDYAIRVKLEGGRYATVNFEVKEQGEIVDMTVEYDPEYATETKAAEPDVKVIDAEGIEANAALRDLEFSISNTRLATIDNDGNVKAKDDDEGVVTVTVVNTKHNVVATAEVRIGEAGAAGIEFDVPEVLMVGEEYIIGMKVVDDDGYEYMDEADYSAVVLSKPDDAKVEVDVYDDELEVYSDTKGEVKIIVTAREDVNDNEYHAVSSTLTLDFVTEPEKVVEGKVFLTIGANFGLVGGVAQDLDAPAFIEEGRTFVPVRFLAEAFGAEADWTPKDAAVETVFLTTDDMEISIGIGDEFLTVTRDGEAEVLTFDGAARIVDGRTFLPFRAIAEAFGAEVDYGPADGPVEWVSFE